MNTKKVGLIFVAIGILAILSFLIYPFINEKTEAAVPVLKTFSESVASENDQTDAPYADNSEIWEKSDGNTSMETSVSEEIQSETAFKAVFPIDINSASIEELMQIKNVGKVIAENIVSYRESYGYFYSVEDLMKVDGISNKRFNAIKSYIYIDSEVLPETSAVRENAFTEDSSSAAVTTESVSVTTVPQSYSEPYSEQTSVRTTGTSYETEDTDDGMIIEEITDFEDFPQTSETNPTAFDITTDLSFSGTWSATEEYYPNFPLELNTASAKDLAYIDGIGDTLAERIVEYARRYGFYDVNDLLNVKGISQGKFNGMLPYVYVDASGLPPKQETETSLSYDDFYDSSIDTSYVFTEETTTSAAPEIYRVNVNTAEKADFMQLPGIDETLAENIISLRNQIGGFVVIEELSLADGMTNSKLSAIWDYIYV